MSSRTIVIIAPPGATLQDVTGPWEVFSRAAVYSPGTYRVVVASVGVDTTISTKFGLGLTCQASIRDLELPLDTVLVSGSDQVFSAPPDEAFLDWLRARAKDARRIGSICTGAFYLAQAGLLDGRRATTHWRYVPKLRDEFPSVRVDAEPIFVRDESFYTSAGITAGIDLALALVEEDCGPFVAQAVAKDLVVFLHRPADQEQISAALAQRMADRRPIRFVQQWAPGHLDAIAGVEDLATLVNMSTRNFARLFRRETGETPGQFIRRLRVEAASRRLRERAGGAEKVAAQVGFGSGRTLRRALKRGVGRCSVDRRMFAMGATAALAAAVMGAEKDALNRRAAGADKKPSIAAGLGEHADAFGKLGNRPITIGVLVFERMDQVDFTGPFAVLSRIRDSTLRIISLDGRPVRDHKGLWLTPDVALAAAPDFDVLQIPGGPGQEALMDNEAVLSLIRRQVESQRVLFSVCTGALLCGAAGVLKGRRATTHWSAFELLPYFGAVPVKARVVVDGNLVSAAGVTAGIDGALQLAALIRGDEAAQRIQLDIQYAPEPPFNAGSPETAPADVLAAVREKYQPLTDARAITARRVAARLGVGAT